MRVPRIQFKLLFAALAVIWASSAWAQDGVKGALAQTNLASPFGHALAVADLDGDSQADGAILLDSQQTDSGARIRIQLHFTARPNAEFSFESTSRALTVRAWDIDQDGDNDLVVEDAFTHKPLRVWINEGHGDFHEGNVQDFPSLAVETDKQIHLPLDDSGSLALWISSQRGFETSILTVHLLGRPPSAHSQLPLLADFSSILAAGSSHSSRAPPFFS